MAKNQLNLLRPVVSPDINTLLCFDDGTGEYKYLAGPDQHDRVCVMTDTGIDIIDVNELRVLPLCWIDSKPVYKGDILTYIAAGEDDDFVYNIIVEGHNSRIKTPETGLEGKIVEVFDTSCRVGDPAWAPVDMWGWPKPSSSGIKVEAWFDSYGELRMFKEGSLLITSKWERAPEFDQVVFK